MEKDQKIMTTTTARHALPLIAPGQAQKEMFHNEALSGVDALLHPAVEAVGAAVPPTDPAPGQSWVVGAGSSGAWAGQADALANWTEGGWRFHRPAAGMRVTVRGPQVDARWNGTAWVVGEVRCERVVVAGLPVLGARQAAIADPAGGTTVDVQARESVAGILAALRAHGLVA